MSTGGVYPGDLLQLAVEKGEVQAFLASDPIAYLWLKDGAYKEVASNLDGEYKDKTCCIVGLRGSLVRDEPQVARALTQAAARCGDVHRAKSGQRRGLVPALCAEDRQPAGSAAMVRYHTHHHHPDGAELKRELKAYADELKTASRSSSRAPTRRNLRSGSMSTYSASKAVALAQSAEEGAALRGPAAVAAGVISGQTATGGVRQRWPGSASACHACGGRIWRTGREPMQLAVGRLRHRRRHSGWRPWLAAGSGASIRACSSARHGCWRSALFLTLWEVATAKFAWLPLPFFPPPQAIIEVYTDDLPKLLDSVFASVKLQLGGYAIGAAVGFLTGVSIGWSRGVGYWVHPVLRFIGPLPATAWLPLAFFTFPSSWSASTFLIALATGFPVTVLTWSGVASVNNAYYDVARTLGAKPSFLVLKVAIPAALPHVFVGLFMGLGASFAVLVVAEMIGVKAGLGWYLQWAQGWAAYANMYAALLVMALMCSGAITLLFRTRDRLLVWQKGVVKW